MSDKSSESKEENQTTYINKSYEATEEEETSTEKPEEPKIDEGALPEVDIKKTSQEEVPTEVPQTASKAFEILLNGVGDYNRYQWRLILITGIISLFTGSHNLSAVFLAATPDHRCQIPYLQNETSFFEDDSLLNLTIPWVVGKNGDLEPSKCTYFKIDHSSLINNFNGNISYEEVKIHIQESYFNNENKSASQDPRIQKSLINSCKSWIYDEKEFKSTVVTEWDLVCNDKWLMSSIQSTFMIGILTGAIVFTIISDKLGRRLSILICNVTFLVTSVAAAFVNSLWMFLVLRFILAACGQGLTLVTYVLLMECLSLKGRAAMAGLKHVFFGVGYLLLILGSYFFREWRVLQLWISVPSVILLIHFWNLPESPRWIFLQGKEKEGIEMLKSMAKYNGIKFPTEEKIKPLLKVIQEEVKNKEKTNFLEKLKSVLDMIATLLRTPNMRRRNLIMFYCWFVSSMLFYGLAFSGANLNVSLYGLSTLAAFADIISLSLSSFLMQRFGRRPTLCGSYLLGGISCICIVFIPLDQSEVKLALAIFGRFNISISFAVVFLFSTEMVPTYIRSISMGMASVWARIGSAIAPFIVDLLGDVYYAIPSTIFGVLSLIAGLLSLLLPETGNKQLPESIEEIEAMKRKDRG